MRNPRSAALLVDHPVVRAPRIEGFVSEGEAQTPSIHTSSLSRRDRYRAAVQLTAAAALFADFDLWLPGAGLRGTRFTRTDRGLIATISNFPMSFSGTLERLGGGEAAVDAARASILRRIGNAVGLEPAAIDSRTNEPGFFLEGAVIQQLRELPRPLDEATARTLWAYRWDPLPEPEEGVVHYWRSDSNSLARRLAGGLYCDLKARQREAWLWPADADTLDTAPVPAMERPGTLILAGEFTHTGLAALSRWVHRDGCSAVAIGSFPSGWRPPFPPCLGGSHLASHLAVVGLPLDKAREFIDQRMGKFNPLSRIDRNATTQYAQWVFSEGGAGPSTPADPTKNVVAEWLALSPEGLPPGFVAVQAGLSPSQLEAQRLAAQVISEGDSWRLAEAIRLRPDPRHADVAELYDRDDPRYVLHSALGTDSPGPLLEWARGSADNLEDSSVRSLLGRIEPGSFGTELQLVLAESCLSMKDLAAARSVLASVPDESGRDLRLWLEMLDQGAGTLRELPTAIEESPSPRAVTETAVIILRRIRHYGRSGAKEVLEVIQRGLPRLHGAIRRRIEIEVAWKEEPNRLSDRTWCRQKIGDHPRLRMQLAYRRGMLALSQGKSCKAREMLEQAAELAEGPGEIGSIEINLGAAALDEMRSRDADCHHLRAYRLLRSAGYSNRTGLALFNLAVSDLDELRITKAQERFSLLAAEAPDDPFVLGELARLSLARGDEELFLERLDRFRAAVDREDSRFAPALNLLEGAAALLAARFGVAIDSFSHAGKEGRTWKNLASAAAGNTPSHTEVDSWGISVAAEMVHSRNDGRGAVESTFDDDPHTVSDALAIALAERVTGNLLPLETGLRYRLVRLLKSAHLDGWSDCLGDSNVRNDGVMAALARVVERGDIRGLEDSHARQLLDGLGLEGLSIQSRDGREAIWETGGGKAGTEVVHGGVVIVPFGGEIDDSPAWKLFLAILGGLIATPSQPIDDDEPDETGFLGVSDEAKGVRREIREMASSHLPILICGETGVGKEVVARALHHLSGRQGQFIGVNIAGIPTGLLEAELFGSVKGAFTGADRSRRGLVATADGGTLLLDELGDLDPVLQVKLLRFLESNEVRAVGSNQVRTVDVRVLSATHRNLEKRMQDGRFRSDLYYRLAGPKIQIPPLRERPRDILVLKEAFEKEASARPGLKICRWSEEAISALQHHSWSGNVRELRQVVEAAILRAAGSTVRIEHLLIPASERIISGTWKEAQQEFRRRFLIQSLRRNGGNRSATARDLGISRQALLYHLRNLGLS